MKTMIMALVATAAALASNLSAVRANDEQVFMYATYYHCSSASAEYADQSVAREYKSHLDGLIKTEGRGRGITAWRWLAKDFGGDWTRAGLLTGSSIDAVLGAVTKYDVMSEGHVPTKHFQRACPSGEDYIWHVLAGSDSRVKPGKYVFSTYFVCDESREMQADDLVARVVAPILEKRVSDGQLVTWLWAEQVIGGKYERLLSLTGDDKPGLVAARSVLGTAAAGESKEGSLQSICGVHQNVIWDVKDQSES